MTQVRRIQFEGDDTAYIQFLEARVLELERIARMGLAVSTSSLNSLIATKVKLMAYRKIEAAAETCNTRRGIENSDDVIQTEPMVIARH
ncbi:hypothetical protein AnigIFM60653_000821 [Aspergillus niger]|nr:hypothetical protein AnigIFM60653_000821 [Aspergillus niger]GLA44329.1 hypothetical protein AnigIFM63309_002917 [Aspergillus niger]